MKPRPELLTVWLPLALGQAAGLVCGLIGVAWTTRLVPPEVMADYGLWLTFTTVGAWVVHVGSTRDSARWWARTPDRREHGQRVLRRTLRELPWVAVGCVAAAAVAALASGGAPWMALVPILILANVGLFAFDWSLRMLQADGRYWHDAAINTLQSASRSFAPLLAAWTLGASALVLSSGFTLGLLVVAGLALLGLRWRGDVEAPVAPGRAPDSTDLSPFRWNGGIGWLAQVMNRWVAVLLLGQLTGGFVVLATSLASIAPSMCSTIVTAAFFPRIFRPQAGSEAAREADRGALLCGGTAALAVLALHFAAPVLVGTLIDVQYAAALPWIAPLGLYAAGLGVSNFYQLLLQAHDLNREARNLRAALTAAALAGGVVTALISPRSFALWLALHPFAAVAVERHFARRWSALRSTA